MRLHQIPRTLDVQGKPTELRQQLREQIVGETIESSEANGPFVSFFSTL